MVTRSIPLADGKYTSGELKVRRNIFTFDEYGWWPFPWCTTRDFFDIQELYSDTYDVGTGGYLVG